MNQETLKPHSLSMIFESPRIWCEASSLDSPIHTNRPFPHCAAVSKHKNWGRDSSGQFHTAISRKVVSKMCMWQYRKVIWDMINTLFLTLKLSNLLYCCFPLALANIHPWAFRAILSNFFEEGTTQNYPQYLSGLSRALFPTTFLGITVYKSLYFVHPSLELAPLFTGMQERSITYSVWFIFANC